ncbi:hypothetical protein R77592_04056 [Ralstonia mannitolilytica]|nr:hypothetical protein R77592_04056 [Ralstonia mannitolilytica]
MSLDNVPEDFPQPSFPIGTQSAQHPFDATLSWRGYVAWVTTEERYDRWAFCEALAKQLLPFAQDEAAKFGDATFHKLAVRAQSTLPSPQLDHPSKVQGTRC